eukprot:697110-Prymnesium_polylepis.1
MIAPAALHPPRAPPRPPLFPAAAAALPPADRRPQQGMQSGRRPLRCARCDRHCHPPASLLAAPAPSAPSRLSAASSS